MTITKPYKIILGLVELFFGIPFVGGAIILANAWTPLFILMVLHAIGIYLDSKYHKNKAGHITGLVGNAIAFIPVVGMICHILIGVILLIQGIMEKQQP